MLKSRGALAIFWLAALWLCLLNLDILNDQFGRISPGRQILAFGELPFRDFLDPGYFLTEFGSAAVQWIFGQNLLGEVLLDSFCIATGCLLVVVLAQRVTGRVGVSLLAGALALLALPRAYDYDKVLFYPLGLWLAWRWFESPTRGRLAAAAAGIVIAALCRYDNGVFLAVAALVGVLTLEWSNRSRAARLAGALVLTVAVLSLPVLVFVAVNGGIGSAADQALAYAVRESARTRITSLPRFQPGSRLVGLTRLPPSQNHVQVRWSSSIASDADRHQIAARLGLEGEQSAGPADRRTWAYVLPDSSAESVRRLVNDPMVEDTGGIDRSRLKLLDPESRWVALQRKSALLRVRVLPDAWTFESAQAALFYILLAIPVVSAVLVAAIRGDRLVRAQLSSAIALCVLLDIFILRDPINARVGGIAGPFAVLGGSIVVACARLRMRLTSLSARTASHAVSVAAILLAVWSLAATVDWTRQLSGPLSDPLRLGPRMARFAMVPPTTELLPTGRVSGMIRYVRDCTASSDRVFISWFLPELFYFAQRGFGGAMSATFGGHWSEPRFQQRSIAALDMHATPILIFQNHRYDSFRADYPLLDEYFSRKYKLGGTTDFGDGDVAPDEYRVLVPVERPASGRGAFGLPCFAGPPHSL